MFGTVVYGMLMLYVSGVAKVVVFLKLCGVSAHRFDHRFDRLFTPANTTLSLFGRGFHWNRPPHYV
jgi:hypothetical protein